MHWVDAAETPASMVRSLREIGTTHYRHLPGMQMLQSEKDEATVAAMVYQAMLADATVVATTAAGGEERTETGAAGAVDAGDGEFSKVSADGAATLMLVLDNADEPEALVDAGVFPPPASLAAHILLTTRCGVQRLATVGSTWQTVEMSMMPPSEAKMLLYRQARCVGDVDDAQVALGVNVM